MLSILIAVIIIALIGWLVFWAVDALGVPNPFNKIVKVITVVVAVLTMLNQLSVLVA